ncbi:hypothetical protein B2G88_14905 [Natronolimnobius baerhuensis]|uniref:Protein-glutamine gamma-glutamyltransferase-like C-terminal domain-containing protein n=2 Tax=Natronolimnobius baerhuensis TaxID=253108 RepID=A0A202E695_9EURY|nr:hypothetical protein B2G88_14905 [Natronolimnobius baerhuensis]
MGTDDDTVATAPTNGPDWAQFGLVLVAIAILALAAVAIPAMGGGSLGLSGAGEDREGDGPSMLPELFSESGEQRSESGSGDTLERGDEDDEEGETDDEDSETADADADDAAGSADEDGLPDEQAGEQGEMDGEFGDGDGGDSWDGDGERPDETADIDGENGEPGDVEDPLEGDTSDGVPGEDGIPDDGDWDEPAEDGELPPDAAEESDTEGDDPFDDMPDDTDERNGDDGELPTENDLNGDPADGGGSESDAFDGTDETEGSDAVDGPDETEDGDSSESGDEPVADESDDPSGESEYDDGAPGEEEEVDDTIDSDDAGPDDDDAVPDTDETSTDDDGPGEDATIRSYDYAFDTPPSPGTAVDVTVTDDGEPVVGETVTFNGEPIGTTDSTGTVTGEVPFTQTLEVDTPTSSGDQSQDVRESLARGGVSPSVGSTRQFAPTRQDQPENGTRTVIEMETNTTLAVDRPAVPGGDVVVTAAVNEYPIPDGTVLVDGGEAGTTDANGTAQVTLPESTGNTTIAVERGEIRAERTLELRDPTLEVTEIIPLPGRTVEATLEHGGEPVENATVAVNGEMVGTTGADGATAVQLPVASEATLSATGAGTTTEIVVDGLYRNAAIVSFGVLAVVLAGWWLLSRRFGVSASSVRSLPAMVASLVRRAGAILQSIGRWIIDAVVRLAQHLEAFGQWLGALLARAARWLASLPRALATQGLAALAAIHPVRLYRLLVGALRSLLRSSKQRVEAVASNASKTHAAPSAVSAEQSEDVRTLRTLWQEFVRLVRPPRLRTQTPGEIGRHAVDRGFPETPVRTVVETFRDAEYGDTPPSESRLERVRSAVRVVAGDNEDEANGETDTDSDDETNDSPESDGGQP